ncbi:DUF5718 family protein [Vibrio diazotrophicus]|uniref:DUF5718 family protein n=1 Tax=Vibrio diazotrophicus TaxID=685 RepID=UPI000C9DB38D|nr:DUF5718 family protein [Vibrio diazotrophicus]PNH95580.1 hypothetical protein C1O24_13850 [Vibrio diazotrophicus]
MNLESCIGFGIAGNFAGHLEQAGESKDFENLHIDKDKPQGIFPFYIPNTYKNLGTYPISDKFQFLSSSENVQVEPEVVLYCELVYNGDVVEKIIPKSFSAFNDCTIRKDNALKISEKKNWGKNSKGISNNWISIDSFDENGILSNYSISSYVYRDGNLEKYGVKAKVSDYTLFYQELLDWAVNCINSQKDEGPLENLSSVLNNAKMPTHCLLAVGATAYESFGENNYIKVGDTIYVVVHKSEDTNIETRILNSDLDCNDISYVKQTTITNI